jgi:hypothetical protein
MNKGMKWRIYRYAQRSTRRPYRCANFVFWLGALAIHGTKGAVTERLAHEPALDQPIVLLPNHTPEPSLPMKPFPLLTKHD